MSDLKRYTLSEVRQRSGRGGGDVWFVYKDIVYDLTNYIHEHPGGDVIMEEAGGDMTKAFEASGHSTDARDILRKYKIGEIVEDEKKYDANGKKRKRVVAVPADKPQGRSCFNVVTCGLIGLTIMGTADYHYEKCNLNIDVGSLVGKLLKWFEFNMPEPESEAEANKSRLNIIKLGFKK